MRTIAGCTITRFQVIGMDGSKPRSRSAGIGPSVRYRLGADYERCLPPHPNPLTWGEGWGEGEQEAALPTARLCFRVPARSHRVLLRACYQHKPWPTFTKKLISPSRSS